MLFNIVSRLANDATVKETFSCTLPSNIIMPTRVFSFFWLINSLIASVTKNYGSLFFMLPELSSTSITSTGNVDSISEFS